ncbi:hypothetical protein GC173_05595 [bacterium]|nr:hypothetical protein [bacterium]
MTFLDRLLDLEKTPQAKPYTAEGYDLDRFRAFVESLGSPQRGLVFVHIAGTKGKGSTAALTEAILRGLGFPTVMYSSPHLVHFGERFRFNGVPWTPDEFAAACDRFWESLGPEQRRGFEPPQPWRTVFEALTALALVEFRAFAQRQPKGLPTVAIWETGLGGRLDCTNIVDPAVSVITALGLDHVSILGGTLEKIAFEKAGIIKPGRPAVIARQFPAHRDRVWPVLLERATEVGAPIIRAEEHNPVLSAQPSDAGQQVVMRLPDGREVTAMLPLAGEFQCTNLEAAVAAAWQVHRLYRRGPADGFQLDGLASANWPGRFEIHRRPDGRCLVLDGAHCPMSAEAIGVAVRQRFPGATPMLLVGMQRDKNAREFLARLAAGLGVDPALIPLVVYTLPGMRGGQAPDLAAAAREAGYTQIVESPASSDALRAARGSLILAVGTLYSLDELRRLWLT